MLAVVACALSLIGCAGHSAKTLKARQALDANQPAQAMTLYNKVLKVKSASELPEKEKKGTAVLILDRSMISQQLGEYENSSQDLEHADKAIEMLDMSRSAVDDIGKYVFSDDAGPYKGAPYEKVMINTQNMVNYLVRHNLNGARVEARRLAIIQKYLKDKDHSAQEMNAPGSYLAGFVFERSGRPDIALRYYNEALEFGDYPSLAGPISRLHGPGSYSTPRLRKFLEKHGYSVNTAQEVKLPAPTEAPQKPDSSTQQDESPAASTEGSPDANEPKTESAPSPSPTHARIAKPEPKATGELLIVINYGRVPAKVAKRIPIGLALTYATANLTGPNRNTANRLAAQGLVTWVNYPELEKKTLNIGPAELFIDGKPYALDHVAAIDLAVRKAFEEERGAIVAAAITRMIARVVAGESLGAAARGASNDNIIGALVSLGTQAALTAADTPDTRSWVTLPARMDIARLQLKPGKHRIGLRARGVVKTIEVTIEPGGWETVSLTVLR